MGLILGEAEEYVLVGLGYGNETLGGEECRPRALDRDV